MSFLFLLLLVVACGRTTEMADREKYIREIEAWQQLRIDSLKGKTGFLNLAGLFWLHQGANTIGSDSSNTFVFPPKAAAFLGTVVLDGDMVWFVQHEPGLVQVSGNVTADTALVFVPDSVQRHMRFGDLNWFIIKRGKEYGIRLKDYNHPLLKTFNHIDTYPIDARWRVTATWEPYERPKEVLLDNQVGMKIRQQIPGAFHFEIRGEPYSLEPVGEPGEEGYFVMVYDQTSGRETYGSGRYLYVPVPDENGQTILDFNKLFNPPCAFTPYATCLFPHAANRLPIKIEAGEKFSGHH